jgi:hypothetical protein
MMMMLDAALPFAITWRSKNAFQFSFYFIFSQQSKTAQATSQSNILDLNSQSENANLCSLFVLSPTLSLIIDLALENEGKKMLIALCAGKFQLTAPT